MTHPRHPHGKTGLLACLALATLTGCTDASGLLGSDASQGVEGTVLLGPLCPVASESDPCPDRPYQARIDIMDAKGNLVGRVSSGDDGLFRAGLRPGRYILRPKSGNPLPRGGAEEVEVVKGVYTSVTVRYDTGIR